MPTIRSNGSGTTANGRSKREAKHVRLYEWMLAGPAYRSLSVHARALLIELKRLYNGENNGKLFLSVRDAAKRLHCGKTRAAKAFSELEDRGFIKVQKRGSFDYKVRHATTWRLMEYSYGKSLPNMDFMRWQPAQEKKPGSQRGPNGTQAWTKDRKTPINSPPPVSQREPLASISGDSRAAQEDTYSLPCKQREPRRRSPSLARSP